MNSTRVSAVLFAKNLSSVAAFYTQALDMSVLASDDHHVRLACDGFELVVHQIPLHIAAGIVLERPPKRRTEAAIRLDFPVQNLAESRRKALELGGSIDDAPPPWAASTANYFFGYDPEGNQFGVAENARRS